MNFFKTIGFCSVSLLLWVTSCNASSNIFENLEEKKTSKETHFLSFKKSQNSNIEEELEKSNESSKKEDFLDLIIKSGFFKIKEKDYGIDIDDALLKSKQPYEIKEEFKEEVIKTLELLQQKNPSEKVVGYSLGLRKGKVTFSSFLGDNAK